MNLLNLRVTQLMDYAREHSKNRSATFVLHATWAYAEDSSHEGFAMYHRDQQTMYKAIIDANIRAAKTVGIDIIIPAGTAIQNGRTSHLGDTFCHDGYHLNRVYGRYTASCVWYEVLFNKSVVGNKHLSKSMTPAQALVAQLAAHYAMRKPFEVTKVDVFCK